MKTLILARHAKADWLTDNQNDFDRPLSESGLIAAKEMAVRLRDLAIFPEQMLSSPAVRAMATAEIYAQILNYPVDNIQTNDKLYLPDAVNLRKIVEHLDDNAQTTIIVSHNPGISAFASYMTGEHVSSLPTCGVYTIDFDIDIWQAISACGGICRFLAAPKDVA